MPRTTRLIAALGFVISGLVQAAPQVGGCPLFPPDNIWNVPIDKAPLDTRSAAYVSSIGATTGLHPDFGAGVWDGGPIGIPFNLATSTTPRRNVSFDYADESDPGPYPIPANPAIEGGPNGTGDRHVLVVDQSACKLYELFAAYPQTDGSWQAGSGAIYDLRSHVLRPAGWTSADAAGLPVLAGLARCEELQAGAIQHALRFTAQRTQRKYIWPARHFASSITDPNVPPMGQRFRLKASFDISRYSAQTQIVLKALKTYGMILADNGSNWYISGAPGSCWDDDALVSELRTVTGSAFEAVDVTGLMIDPNSGATRTGAVPNTKTLTVTKSGTGQGTIISTPAGINCGTACAAPFESGRSVSLQATAAAGSSFVRWLNGCAGTTASTSIVVNADTQCGAEFALRTVTADLAMRLTVPTQAALSTNFSFTARATNLGPMSAPATKVTIRLPTALRFVSAATGCTHAAGVVTCNLGTVPSGVGISKRIRVRPNARGSYSINASGVATTTDPNAANNTAIASVQVN